MEKVRSGIEWLKARPRLMEFVRFAVVGTIAAGIHYVLYLFLLWIMGIDWRAKDGTRWQENLAYTSGYVISLCINLWLTAHFTFRERITVKRSGGFLVSHAINYLIHMGLLNLYLLIGIADWLAAPLVLPIAVPVNFILVRTAFKKL